MVRILSGLHLTSYVLITHYHAFIDLFSQFDVQTLSKILAMLTVFENIQNVKKHHKIFWLSKDDSTGNNEEKNRNRKRWPEDNISSASYKQNKAERGCCKVICEVSTAFQWDSIE